jgi:hypothetical protein
MSRTQLQKELVHVCHPQKKLRTSGLPNRKAANLKTR